MVFSCLWQCWRLVRSFWAYATKQCCQNTYIVIVVDKFCGVGLPLTDNEPIICNQVLSYPQPVQQFNPSCSKCFHQTWHQWWLCALNIINHLFGNKRCQFRIHFHHHPNFSKVILKSYFIGLQCTPRASKTQEFVAVFFSKTCFFVQCSAKTRFLTKRTGFIQSKPVQSPYLEGFRFLVQDLVFFHWVNARYRHLLHQMFLPKNKGDRNSRSKMPSVIWQLLGFWEVQGWSH